MLVRRLITLLMALLMASPLLAGQAWCACAAELAMSTGSCCCKGAHAAADAARAQGQDTVHKDCCCDTVDQAAPVSGAVDAPAPATPAPVLGTFAPAAACTDAERHTAASLGTDVLPVEQPPWASPPEAARLAGVRLRP